MVTLEFKLSDLGTVEIEIDRPTPLTDLLGRCSAPSGTDAASYIAIRAGKVIQGGSLIHDGETVTLLPAISGG